jgi:uncharacterized membrane protein YgcG
MLARRIARHWYQSLHPARKLLPAESLAQIESEIQSAERTHAGEIRVAVEAALSFGLLWRDISARERALQVFASLGIWDTKHNNGVLIYVLLADRAIEIVADRGISAHIPPAEWQALCNEVSEHFRQGDLTSGCCVAVRSVGRRLARFFPASAGEGNELPNQPVLL